MNYMGIDHHKQYSHLTIMDEEGKVLKSGRVLNYRREVEEFIGNTEEEIRAVIEAGRASYVMVDMLEGRGVEVKLAHSKEIKSIARAKIKTDKRDSKILADLLRANLIPEVHKRSVESRRAQRVLRQRVFFVSTMTRVKNRIQALLAQQGERIEDELGLRKDLFTRGGIKRLKTLNLAAEDKKLLEGLLELYEGLEALIKNSEKLVNDLYKRMKEAQLISTVPGFGGFFSVLVATEIDDINRFDSAEKLHSYAGVIPSTHSSGERLYHGKIVKEGNRWLRWAAVEAVWPAIRSDFDLRVFFQRHSKRKNVNVAKVITARRLLTIIYKILKEGRCYVPYPRNKIILRLPSGSI